MSENRVDQYLRLRFIGEQISKKIKSIHPLFLKEKGTDPEGFFETEKGPIVASVILWHAIDSQRSEYVTGGSTAAPIFSEIVEKGNFY